jgi:hypothetical protein
MAKTTFRVHGGLHHNGIFYPHGASVPESLFGSNPGDPDELKTLVRAGTLKTEAEFLNPEQLQSGLDERDAEIERLKAELAAAQAAKTEHESARDAAMEEARTSGESEAAEEQFPKSTL